MTRRGLVCLALLAATACSSSGEGSPGSDGSDPTVPVPATDAEATTTTSPPTTTVTTTSSSTTTTTLAPTTTVDPIAEIEAAVKQARLDGEAAINAAGFDPANDALRMEVARFNTGPRLTETTSFLDQLVADGLAFRQDADNPSFIEFEGSIELPDGAASTEAYLVECRVDTDIVFVVQENPDAPEIVVDDAVVAFRSRVRYIVEDGQWKNESGQQIQRAEGDSLCEGP